MEGGHPCEPRYGRGLFYREAFLDSGGGSSAPSVRHTNYFAAAGVCASRHHYVIYDPREPAL